MCNITNSPRVRFVEKGSPTVMETVRRTSPGAKDWSCGRKECVPCLSRCFLRAEEAEDILWMREGQEVKKKKPEDQEGVDGVQLGVFQTASLPVSLGNKLKSPCVTGLKTLFLSIYGKIPLKNT